MVWLVRGAIGCLLAVLLTIGWWYDRDARRRGASPRGAAAIGRSASDNRRNAIVRSYRTSLGATPRGQEAVAESWRRPDCPPPPGR